MTISRRILVLFAAVTLLAGASAQAGPIYYFGRITANAPTNVAAQLSVEVIANGDGTVSFKFFNDVGIQSSITDIYFDDGTLLGLSEVADSDAGGSGVSFTKIPTNPPVLPGGNSITPKFEVTAGFSAGSETPATGVDLATEWVMITFGLKDAQTYANTIAALQDGTLRIGLHVQSIPDGSGGTASDGFVNRVPDGGMTASLLGLALLGLGWFGRRR